MARIFQRNCYFFRRTSDREVSCAANGTFCFMCPLKIRRINGLTLEDHLTLVYSRISVRRAFVFATLSLLISCITLGLKLIESVVPAN